MRQTYEMTQEQYEAILVACKPPAMIMLQCGPVRSVQESANDAWERLGNVLGFHHMTVRPAGTGPRFFTAEPKQMPTTKDEGVVYELDGASWCAHRADWPGLPDGVCGFGDTKEEAVQAMLEEESK